VTPATHRQHTRSTSDRLVSVRAAFELSPTATATEEADRAEIAHIALASALADADRRESQR